MICNKCNFNNLGDARFCARCGNPLIIMCKKCGKEFSSDTAFCDNCGNNLYANNRNNVNNGNIQHLPSGRKRLSIVSIVSMTLGIVALFLCILSFFYPILFAIPAIITGAIGLKPNRNLKGLAIGGLILGIIVIVICLVAMIGFRTMSLMN